MDVWSGVQPLVVFASTSASLSSNSFVILSYPSLIEQINFYIFEFPIAQVSHIPVSMVRCNGDLPSFCLAFT